MGILNQIPVVVVATGTMNAGGTESLIMETFRQATGRVKYILLVHYDGEIPEGVFDKEIKRLGIQVEYIGSVGALGMNGYIREFKKLASRVGHIDIVHSHLNGVGGVIALAAKRAGIRHRVCHCHADIHYTGNKLSRFKQEVALMGMKAFIDIYATDRWACSAAAWKRLFMPWRERTVIDNMIDTEKYFSTPEKISVAKQKFGLAGRKVIGAVGRVAPIKNYELILNAMVETDVNFVCFGRFDPQNKYCASLMALADELGISERVHWLGNSNDIPSDIHCIDLFVMPSFTEGFGMAAIEAQAAGIPALLSNGVPEIVDVDAGLVTFLNPYDVEAWHDAIEKGFESKNIPGASNLLEKFIAKGFDSPTAVKEIENKYISIATK